MLSAIQGLNFTNADSSTPNKLIKTTAGYSKNARASDVFVIPPAWSSASFKSPVSDCVFGNMFLLIVLTIFLICCASFSDSGYNVQSSWNVLRLTPSNDNVACGLTAAPVAALIDLPRPILFNVFLIKNDNTLDP